MRMMLRVRINTARGNEAVKSGTLAKSIGDFTERAKPEAAYFTVDNGQRTAFFVFDMKESSQMPLLAEDMFMALGAELHFSPVMNAGELKAGLGALEHK
jgi:hypothetical protein